MLHTCDQSMHEPPSPHWDSPDQSGSTVLPGKPQGGLSASPPSTTLLTWRPQSPILPKQWKLWDSGLALGSWRSRYSAPGRTRWRWSGGRRRLALGLWGPPSFWSQKWQRRPWWGTWRPLPEQGEKARALAGVLPTCPPQNSPPLIQNKPVITNTHWVSTPCQALLTAASLDGDTNTTPIHRRAQWRAGVDPGNLAVEILPLPPSPTSRYPAQQKGKVQTGKMEEGVIRAGKR